MSYRIRSNKTQDESTSGRLNVNGKDILTNMFTQPMISGNTIIVDATQPTGFKLADNYTIATSGTFSNTVPGAPIEKSRFAWPGTANRKPPVRILVTYSGPDTATITLTIKGPVLNVGSNTIADVVVGAINATNGTGNTVVTRNGTIAIGLYEMVVYPTVFPLNYSLIAISVGSSGASGSFPATVHNITFIN